MVKGGILNMLNIKKVALSFAFVLTMSICSSEIAFAADNIKEKFAKHYVENTNKAEIKALADNPDVIKKISMVFPENKKFTFGEPIKLYKLEDSIIGNYNEKDKLEKYISKDYRIVQAIKDNSGKILGTIVFTKLSENDLKKIEKTDDANMKQELMDFYKKNENKWHISQIGDYFPEESLQLISNISEIQHKISSIDTENIDDITLVDSSDEFPAMIYIEGKKAEYAMPIINNTSGNIYEVNKLVSLQAKAIKEQSESNSKDILTGGANINTQTSATSTENKNQVLVYLGSAFIIICLVLFKFRSNISKSLIKK
jgi:hypothetical protein